MSDLETRRRKFTKIHWPTLVDSSVNEYLDILRRKRTLLDRLPTMADILGIIVYARILAFLSRIILDEVRECCAMRLQ